MSRQVSDNTTLREYEREGESSEVEWEKEVKQIYRQVFSEFQIYASFFKSELLQTSSQ